MMNKNRIGKIGEKLTAQYLQKNKYEILYRNYYTKKGEIDIIAVKQKIISFIEVKTRSNFKYGNPVDAVNYTKIKHIIKTAEIFLYENKEYEDYEINIDVIEVIIREGKCRFNHIKNILSY